MPDTKIIHLRNKCIGCNACVCNAPQNWIMDEKDGKSHLIGAKQKGEFFVAKLDPQDLQDNIKAAAACPMRIIQINQ